MFLTPGSRARQLSRQRDLLGYQIAVGVASSSLIITLAVVPGASPFIEFRDQTSTNGNPVFRQIPNGAQFIINSGNTMGAANSSALRLWVLGFDNGKGGITLGAINCQVGGATASQVVGLDEATVQSPTGPNGGSTAGTFYASQTLTGRPFRILGYLEWSSGVAVAGTWTAPTKIQLFGPGIKKPGDIVQTAFASTTTGAGTSAAAYTTGLTQAISLTSAPNLVKAASAGRVGISSLTNPCYVTLFRGATQLQSILFVNLNAATLVGGASHMCYDKPNTTSSTSYTVQLQSDGTRAVTWAQSGDAGQFGTLTLEEIMA